MLIIPLPDLLFGKKPVSKFGTNQNLDGFSCIIKEVSFAQDYQNPSQPRDDNQSQNDTTYRMPKFINVVVYVDGKDILTFENDTNTAQLNESLFFVRTLHNQIYRNLKITSISKSTSAENISGAYYNITLQEVILVKALVTGYKNSKKAGYSNKKNIGSQNPQKVQKKSLALTGLEKIQGAF